MRRFYDPRLRRRGAFPLPVKLVLFGPGTVHGLDDAQYHHRKALYLEALTPNADPGFTLRTYTHLVPSSFERARTAVDGVFAPTSMTGDDLTAA